MNHPDASHRTTAFGYDNDENLTALTVMKDIAPVASYTYQLGATGIWQSGTELGGRAATWMYDCIDRLTNEAIQNDPHAKNGSVGYGLDPVSNRLTQTATLPGIALGNFTFDAQRPAID